jgi:gluconate transporter
MASTLGFVAVVLGLGAMFGAILEAAGGIQAIANTMLKRFGEKHAPWAVCAAAFIVGIPLFFDVGFIILAPILMSLQKRSGRNILYFGAPLLAALAATHGFVPPHPGPVAVSDLLHADLGLVAFYGLICALPASIIAGPLFAIWRYGDKPAQLAQAGSIAEVLADADAAAPPGLQAPAADSDSPQASSHARPVTFGAAVFALLLPIGLIFAATAAETFLPKGALRTTLEFIGHPFVALVIACLYVWIVFGVLRRTPRATLLKIMNRSMEPAGAMAIVTGAGGSLKQVLVDTGAGEHLAQSVALAGFTPMVFGFCVAALVRIAQGSATVAMITAGGLVSPLLVNAGYTPTHTALVVVAIGCGAIVSSHVNDAGFWLVNRYLGLTEAETLRSWTVVSTIVGLVGFSAVFLLSRVL